ncbi:hypothetical protein JAAARDRAFT_139109 [Jaapia argillacea MUCL 33604]|uniref:Uncharacterized protein n=1 Tax=Jaapia argillacea MUCL 33604 TaxID=933084 RepID=A0A067PBW6_9AGAM|nr:hypothetical protein JAAARDRAFT_139109 [Jaapia argillacea MUCL 33604]
MSLVLGIYSKSGGKNGKHCWVSDASMITAVSYLAVQTFEKANGRTFREIPQALRNMRACKFALLPSTLFLCALDTMPHRVAQSIQLSQQDYARLKLLEAGLSEIQAAIKSLTSRPKKTDLVAAAQAGGEEESGTESGG